MISYSRAESPASQDESGEVLDRCETSTLRASGTAMGQRSAGTRDVRLSWTMLLAAALATLGVVRLFCDFLTDIDPTWVSVLGESPLRLLARTTDGSLVGNLNTQYFKVMAIPCGIAGIFLVNGGLTGGIPEAERRWARPRFRVSCIIALAAVCAFCEVEKATHLLGLPTGLVDGEQAWLNHVVHNVGGVLAYPLSRILRYRVATPQEPSAPFAQETQQQPRN